MMFVHYGSSVAASVGHFVSYGNATMVAVNIRPFIRGCDLRHTHKNPLIAVLGCNSDRWEEWYNSCSLQVVTLYHFHGVEVRIPTEQGEWHEFSVASQSATHLCIFSNIHQVYKRHDLKTRWTVKKVMPALCQPTHTFGFQAPRAWALKHSSLLEAFSPVEMIYSSSA